MGIKLPKLFRKKKTLRQKAGTFMREYGTEIAVGVLTGLISDALTDSSKLGRKKAKKI